MPGLGLGITDVAIRSGGSSAGGPSFDVLGASLLEAYDAEQPATIVQSGGLVSSWIGLVAARAPAQAFGAQRPVLSPDAVAGRPGVRFDGTDDWLGLEGVSGLPTGAAGSEVWVLANHEATNQETGEKNLFSWGYTTNTSRRCRVWGRGGDPVAEHSIGTPYATVAADAKGVHLFRFIYDGGGAIVEVDGVAGTRLAVATDTIPQRLRIGASPSTTPNSFGKVSINFIALTTLLDETKESWLRAFLNGRRGVA